MQIKIFLYGFSVILFFGGCNGEQKKAGGMVLVKKNPGAVTTSNIALETLLIPTNEAVVSFLAVTSPERRKMAVLVQAYGTIEYDTRYAFTISTRISGRIEKMYVRYRYQEIKKGQKIMDIYSPEILTAEQNLLFLLRSDAGNTSFIQAAKERLLLLGMSREQLGQVIETGKPDYSVSIYSSYSGHVHEAGMIQDGLKQPGPMPGSEPLTQELSLKEGMYVQKGQSLLMIMDHHMVWAALQIFASDESLVKAGSRVSIISETDESAIIEGRIDFIEPFFRAERKTLTARVYFHNEAMLPVGTHVSATIYSIKQNSLWLPESSVLSLGMNNIVFKKAIGGFMAHKITAGIHSEGNVEVISGLNEKDSVAVNGQYFMDSESFIQSP